MNTLKFFILGLTIAVINAKPQGSSQRKQDSQIKVDKQYVYELPKVENKERTLLENSSHTKSRAQNTKEILDKISKLNTELGYTTKKGLKSIDYDENISEIVPEGHNRALQPYPQINYQYQNDYSNHRPEFHQSSPFDNPITEYLKSLNEKNIQNTVFSRNGGGGADNYENHDQVDNTDVDNDDEMPKGQAIKRKIIHRQSIMMPNPFMMNNPGRYPTGTPGQYPMHVNAYPSYPVVASPEMHQYPPQMFAYPNYIPQPYRQENPIVDSNRREFNNSNETPYPLGFYDKTPQGRQLSWPFQSYFPIVINDPFLSVYNAFSQMIEYGPEADLCKRVSNVFKGKPRPKSDDNSLRSGKALNSRSAEFEEDSSTDEDSSSDEIVIDQLALHAPKKTFLQSFLQPRKFPDPEKDDDLSANKYRADDNMEDLNNDANRSSATDKTFFSKDNMGNGIFIHKLKVRKGGVAIAGPGGIATAGSGGTAVVGPGGYAYTQQDGVAIAGPGAKVYSIPETHNLTQIILKAHTDGKSLNANGEPRSLPPGSKIVATGPVVYHNKGDN